MVVATLLCSASTLQAQDNKLYFEDFTVSGGEVVNVPILLDNASFEAGAFQCDIELPWQLEIAGDLIPSDRLNDDMQLILGSTGKLGIVNYSKEPFAGDNGPLFYLPIREKRGVENDAEVSITLSDIILTTVNGQSSVELKDFTGYVQVNGVTPTIEAYTNNPSFTIAQGGTQVFSFCFTNNFDVAGFQVNVTLPEGLSVEGTPVKTDRLTKNARIQMTDRGNGVYNFMVVDLTGGIPVVGDEGPVFNVTIKADEAFNAENAEIVVNEFIAAKANADEVFGNSFTVKVSDTKEIEAAYNNALALVENLKAALDEALAHIEETCPLVKGDYNGEAILAAIDNLSNDIESAHTDMTIIDKYADFETAANNIKAEIEALVNEATEAQRVALAADNEARYNEVVAILDGLQAELSAAIEGANPSANLEAEIEAAQNAINEAYAAATEAFNNLAEGEAYEYTVDAEAIQALIAAIDEKSQTVTANLAAYNAQVEVLDALTAQLDEALANANDNDVDVTEEYDAALAAISAEREAAANALETEEVFSYEVNADEIKDLIAKVNEEVARVIANRDAYNDAIATIDELQNELKDMIVYVVMNYPGTSVDSAVAAAQEAIDNARVEATNELEAVAESGDYNYTVDVDAIMTLINNIEKAAQSSGISSINIDNLGNDVKVYDLNGREIKNAKAGSVVIIRNADGKASKMIVK